MLTSVRVIGAGLIGTSIALALKNAGKKVEVVDSNSSNLAIASDLVKSEEISTPDLILVAVPVEVTKQVVLKALLDNPGSVVCDLASVKSDLQVEIAKLSDGVKRFISLHPMAGRESSGAESARADLFDGRAWIGIKNSTADQQTQSLVSELIDLCQGNLYWFTAKEHDELVAAISHLPQLVSSALAAELLGLSEDQLNVAGQGIKDMTRLAKSNPLLWSQIFLQNRLSLVPAIQSFINSLEQLKDDIEKNQLKNIVAFLEKGNSGKEKIPGKHGARSREYAYLPIVIDDKPGELSKIFNICAEVNVNIEDLTIEHSPGQETGLITLAVSKNDIERLSTHLLSKGMKVHAAKNR